MKKVAVVYWSGTGNTEAMAQAVLEGAGADGKLFDAGSFSADMIKDFDAVAFGCPSMGSEVLEEEVFQPLWDSCVSVLGGTPIALFGSYGWGDGEWMRNWDEDAKAAGLNIACQFVICNEAPDDSALADCRRIGEALAM
ncbi:MAG: flavodoxin domain-containing protein [Peptostreptococcaceae bacterium]|nr:flavodoxin domain-containing protein [Peptostreptococcaceae bacterium]MDY5739034.1 flavodoxin domain-containing protein [Anaerovoracaceae bacterium]